MVSIMFNFVWVSRATVRSGWIKPWRLAHRLRLQSVDQQNHIVISTTGFIV